MGHFAPGDLKASWVALWILFILWWFTILPKFYYSFIKKREGADEDAAESAKVSRAHKAYGRARDGVLWLLTAISISFAGQGNEAATNALAYIFMSFWIILVILSYFVDSKKLHSIGEFISVAFLFALIITVWGSASGRFLVR